MDTSSDQFKSVENKPGGFSILLHIVQGFVKWLARFFNLTDEDRMQAGIFLDGEKQ
jgi:hypothetical protein